VGASGRAKETMDRCHRLRSAMYPELSVAYLAPRGSAVAAGSWARLPVPAAVPPWMAARDNWAGAIGIPVKDSPGEEDLIVRTVVKVGAGGSAGAVVVDIPLDDQVQHQLSSSTGVRLENVYDARSDVNRPARGPAT